ncbi:MAG: ABC transporter permease [Planctomycetaceae bacterium]
MYKLLLCLRYLRTRYIALASIISVMLGVATMIVVNSVMAGFSNEMRDRIHGFLADIVVEARSMDGIRDADAQMARVRDAVGDYVAAMTPTVEVPAMITFSDPLTGENYTTDVIVVGIDPAGKASVGPLRSYLASYNPVIEDGRVVQPAERSEDEPLGWNLTPQSAEYRKLVKSEEALFLQPERRTPATSDQAHDAPPGNVPEDIAAPEFESSDEAFPAGDGHLAESAAPAPPPVFADDPFPEHVPGGQAPNGAPLAARIYIGDGLVSFLAEDPRTGKSEKHYMKKPGEDIIITTMTAGTPPTPVSFQATVVDLFRSGMSEYDGNLVLMNLDELQKVRGMVRRENGLVVPGSEAITSIQIKLKNYDDAEEVVRRLQAAFLPGEVSVRTWEAKQGLLLSAVDVETAILNVLLFLIIAVAGFGILAIFFMIVVEKTRDIGILKSLGASSAGVMSIFLSYGLGLGIVGSAAGVTIGLLFVKYINQIEDALSWLTGRKVFDEKIYYFFEIPTQVSPMMVFCVALGAVGIAVLASVLPARRASRLHPVRALRYE